MKKAVVLGGMTAVVVLVGGASAYAAPNPSFGGCQLDGHAKFAQPLGANQPKPVPSAPNGTPWTNNVLDIDWGPAFSYTFDGTLSNCQSAGSAGPDAKAPATGKIDAGSPFTIGDVTYDWPFDTPNGHGGCTGSNTSGTSVVVWADDSVSIIDYSTTGALAAVGLTGNFREGTFTFTGTNPDGTPASKTVTLRYGHDYTAGPVAFEPPDATACNGAGVTEADIQGVLGEGYLQTVR